MKLEMLFGYLLLMFGSCSIALGAYVGINIGTDLLNLPSPEQVVAILRSHQITNVRLFDADNHLLSALSDTEIEVMVSVTNEEVLRIGQSPAAAAAWINKNIAAFVPSTNITAIAVGSEVLSTIPHAGPVLVPAMKNLHKSLVSSNLNSQVKVSTPFSMDLIPKPFPPSDSTFNSSWDSIISEVLQFLKSTNSFFMLNAYPYYGYVQSNGIFPIEYALFQALPPVKQIVDPNTLFHYDSMLDSMVDATYNSISALNISVIPIVVTETGWPWAGGASERDATLENAETFNNNLIKRVLNGSGPPSQPAIPMNTFIYELFNEDKKPGPLSEQSYGVYFSNGSSVYTFSLGASDQVAVNGSGGFCVAKKGADTGSLQDGLNWACGPGQANCSAIQSGQPCYMPDTIENHASFAYNDYYQKMRSVGGTCDFGGTAVLTTDDPSNGSCIFTGSTNSSIGGTVTPALGPDGPPGNASPGQLPHISVLLLAVVVLLVV
ncbi:glucan endo-1,3-beta-glucosidase 4-like isoform X2 [Bidens hawaiensis]|uniref:glucan endo-1,3-beta-glucosidase 4-like isoform X2 n=1 Tax=Bidens hawaiensis TaxID=980011 RepID=UPI004049E117